MRPTGTQITCLDAASGELRWRSEPLPLEDDFASLSIHVDGDRAVVQSFFHRALEPDDLDAWKEASADPDAYDEFFLEVGQSFLLDLPTGEVISTTEGGTDTTGMVPSLPELQRPSKTADDRRISYDGLELVSVGEADDVEPQVRLESPPSELFVAGDLAIWSLQELGGYFRGGEVVAFDLARGVPAWTFEAWRHRAIASHSVTQIALDGKAVVMGVGPMVASLESATGEPRWIVDLQQAPMDPWLNPTSRFGRTQDRLLVSRGRNLFALDPSDGRVVWSFDAGEGVSPWPTRVEGLLLIQTSESTGGAEEAGFSDDSLAGEAGELAGHDEAESVLRIGTSPPSLVLVSVHDLSPTVELRSSFSHPVADAEASEWVVEITRADGELFFVGLPASVASGAEEAFVALTDWSAKARLLHLGETVAEYEVFEPLAEGQPFAGWVAPFFFSMAVLIWLYTAFVVKKSAREFRFSEIEKLYKRSMLKTSLYNLFPTLVVGLFVGITTGVAILIVGPYAYLPMLAFAIVVIVISSFLALNWTALAGNKELEQGVREVLARQAQVPEAKGHFIGIAPRKGTPKLDQLVDSHGDIGLLFLTEDRLVIEGMKARWEIPRSNLTRLSRKRIWQFALLGARWMVFEYRPTDGAGDSVRTLRVESRQGSTIHQTVHRTDELFDRIEVWRSLGVGASPGRATEA